MQIINDICMVSEKCDQCFEQILKQVEKKSDQFFHEQAEKHDKYLDRLNQRENLKLIVNLFYIGIFITFVGYTYSKQENFKEQLGLKANISDVFKKTEAQIIIEQGDEFNRNVYVKKEFIDSDTFTYGSNKKLIFQNGLRSGEKEYFKEAYDKIINNNKN